MDASDETTGSDSATAPGSDPRRKGPWGWELHLGLLTLYPIILGAIGFMLASEGGEPALPGSVSGLLMVSVQETALFLIVFGLAWAASRARISDLMLRWHSGLWFLIYGIFYSLALRVALAVISFILVVVVSVVAGIGPDVMAEKMRPRTEVLIDVGALRDNPVYFTLALTLISFVVAGLREELWRAGMLAGLDKLFPNWFAGRTGKMLAVGVTALVFGLGHLPQGLVGVVLTTLLGVGLGAIMLIHRSIWPAVLAHGFFNAGSFTALYLIKDTSVSDVPVGLTGFL